MPELHRYHREPVLLSRAADADVIALLGAPPVAMLTGRTAFRVLSGTDVAHDANLDDVYGARIFGPAGELRWQHEIGEQPVAALVLRERPPAAPAGWTPHAEPLRWTAAIEQRYLLWGTIVETSGQAHVMHEARVGPFEIPAAAVAANRGDRLQLVSHELLGHSGDDDPNTRVVEELLCRLEAGGETWPQGME